MKPADAVARVHRLAVAQGAVHFTRHALARMQQRGVSDMDVIRCLRTGLIEEGPYRDARTGDWRCNIEGRWAGQTVRVGVALPASEDIIIVITVIDVRG